MYVDNKKTGTEVRYVLLSGIGQCLKGDGDYLVSVDRKLVESVIEKFMDTY
jgi:hypothetical protein